MGKYTENLTKRSKLKFAPFMVKGTNISRVRLVCCAIIRDGIIHTAGNAKSHNEIRRSLGDEDPYSSTPGDEEGFLTNEGDFADRKNANLIGAKAGQCQVLLRKFLSSDVTRW